MDQNEDDETTSSLRHDESMMEFMESAVSLHNEEMDTRCESPNFITSSMLACESDDKSGDAESSGNVTIDAMALSTTDSCYQQEPSQPVADVESLKAMRRVRHNNKEKERKDRIKVDYEEIRSLLPQSYFSDKKQTHHDMLQLSLKFMKTLLHQNKVLSGTAGDGAAQQDLAINVDLVSQLQKENEDLRNEICRYRRIIDNAGIPNDVEPEQLVITWNLRSSGSSLSLVGDNASLHSVSSASSQHVNAVFNPASLQQLTPAQSVYDTAALPTTLSTSHDHTASSNNPFTEILNVSQPRNGLLPGVVFHNAPSNIAAPATLPVIDQSGLNAASIPVPSIQSLPIPMQMPLIGANGQLATTPVPFFTQHSQFPGPIVATQNLSFNGQLASGPVLAPQNVSFVAPPHNGQIAATASFINQNGLTTTSQMSLIDQCSSVSATQKMPFVSQNGQIILMPPLQTAVSVCDGHSVLTSSADAAIDRALSPISDADDVVTSEIVVGIASKVTVANSVTEATEDVIQCDIVSNVITKDSPAATTVSVDVAIGESSDSNLLDNQTAASIASSVVENFHACIKTDVADDATDKAGKAASGYDEPPAVAVLCNSMPVVSSDELSQAAENEMGTVVAPKNVEPVEVNSGGTAKLDYDSPIIVATVTNSDMIGTTSKTHVGPDEGLSSFSVNCTTLLTDKHSRTVDDEDETITSTENNGGDSRDSAVNHSSVSNTDVETSTSVITDVVLCFEKSAIKSDEFGKKTENEEDIKKATHSIEKRQQTDEIAEPHNLSTSKLDSSNLKETSTIDLTNFFVDSEKQNDIEAKVKEVKFIGGELGELTAEEQNLERDLAVALRSGQETDFSEPTQTVIVHVTEELNEIPDISLAPTSTDVDVLVEAECSSQTDTATKSNEGDEKRNIDPSCMDNCSSETAEVAVSVQQHNQQVSAASQSLVVESHRHPPQFANHQLSQVASQAVQMSEFQSTQHQQFNMQPTAQQFASQHVQQFGQQFAHQQLAGHTQLTNTQFGVMPTPTQPAHFIPNQQSFIQPQQVQQFGQQAPQQFAVQQQALPGADGSSQSVQGTLVLHNGQLLLVNPQPHQQALQQHPGTLPGNAPTNPSTGPFNAPANTIFVNQFGGQATLPVPAPMPALGPNQTVMVNTPSGPMALNTMPSQPNQHPSALILPNGQIVPVVTQPNLLFPSQHCTPVSGGLLVPSVPTQPVVNFVGANRLAVSAASVSLPSGQAVGGVVQLPVAGPQPTLITPSPIIQAVSAAPTIHGPLRVPTAAVTTIVSAAGTSVTTPCIRQSVPNLPQTMMATMTAEGTIILTVPGTGTGTSDHATNKSAVNKSKKVPAVQRPLMPKPSNQVKQAKVSNAVTTIVSAPNVGFLTPARLPPAVVASPQPCTVLPNGFIMSATSHATGPIGPQATFITSAVSAPNMTSLSVSLGSMDHSSTSGSLTTPTSTTDILAKAAESIFMLSPSNTDHLSPTGLYLGNQDDQLHIDMNAAGDPSATTSVTSVRPAVGKSSSKPSRSRSKKKQKSASAVLSNVPAQEQNVLVTSSHNIFDQLDTSECDDDQADISDFSDLLRVEPMTPAALLPQSVGTAELFEGAEQSDREQQQQSIHKTGSNSALLSDAVTEISSGSVDLTMSTTVVDELVSTPISFDIPDLTKEPAAVFGEPHKAVSKMSGVSVEAFEPIDVVSNVFTSTEVETDENVPSTDALHVSVVSPNSSSDALGMSSKSLFERFNELLVSPPLASPPPVTAAVTGMMSTTVVNLPVELAAGCNKSSRPPVKVSSPVKKSSSSVTLAQVSSDIVDASLVKSHVSNVAESNEKLTGSHKSKTSVDKQSDSRTTRKSSKRSAVIDKIEPVCSNEMGSGSADSENSNSGSNNSGSDTVISEVIASSKSITSAVGSVGIVSALATKTTKALQPKNSRKTVDSKATSKIEGTGKKCLAAETKKETWTETMDQSVTSSGKWSKESARLSVRVSRRSNKDKSVTTDSETSQTVNVTSAISDHPSMCEQQELVSEDIEPMLDCSTAVVKASDDSANIDCSAEIEIPLLTNDLTAGKTRSKRKAAEELTCCSEVPPLLTAVENEPSANWGFKSRVEVQPDVMEESTQVSRKELRSLNGIEKRARKVPHRSSPATGAQSASILPDHIPDTVTFSAQDLLSMVDVVENMAVETQTERIKKSHSRKHRSSSVINADGELVIPLKRKKKNRDSRNYTDVVTAEVDQQIKSHVSFNNKQDREEKIAKVDDVQDQKMAMAPRIDPLDIFNFVSDDTGKADDSLYLMYRSSSKKCLDLDTPVSLEKSPKSALVGTEMPLSAAVPQMPKESSRRLSGNSVSKPSAGKENGSFVAEKSDKRAEKCLNNPDVRVASCEVTTEVNSKVELLKDHSEANSNIVRKQSVSARHNTIATIARHATLPKLPGSVPRVASKLSAQSARNLVESEVPDLEPGIAVSAAKGLPSKASKQSHTSEKVECVQTDSSKKSTTDDLPGEDSSESSRKKLLLDDELVRNTEAKSRQNLEQQTTTVDHDNHPAREVKQHRSHQRDDRAHENSNVASGQSNTKATNDPSSNSTTRDMQQLNKVCSVLRKERSSRGATKEKSDASTGVQECRVNGLLANEDEESLDLLEQGPQAVDENEIVHVGAFSREDGLPVKKMKEDGQCSTGSAIGEPLNSSDKDDGKTPRMREEKQSKKQLVESVRKTHSVRSYHQHSNIGMREDTKITDVSEEAVDEIACGDKKGHQSPGSSTKQDQRATRSAKEDQLLATQTREDSNIASVVKDGTKCGDQEKHCKQSDDDSADGRKASELDGTGVNCNTSESAFIIDQSPCREQSEYNCAFLVDDDCLDKQTSAFESICELSEVVAKAINSETASERDKNLEASCIRADQTSSLSSQRQLSNSDSNQRELGKKASKKMPLGVAKENTISTALSPDDCCQMLMPSDEIQPQASTTEATREVLYSVSPPSNINPASSVKTTTNDRMNHSNYQCRMDSGSYAAQVSAATSVQLSDSSTKSSQQSLHQQPNVSCSRQLAMAASSVTLSHSATSSVQPTTLSCSVSSLSDYTGQLEHRYDDSELLTGRNNSKLNNSRNHPVVNNYSPLGNGLKNGGVLNDRHGSGPDSCISSNNSSSATERSSSASRSECARKAVGDNTYRQVEHGRSYESVPHERGYGEPCAVENSMSRAGNNGYVGEAGRPTASNTVSLLGASSNASTNSSSQRSNCAAAASAVSQKSNLIPGDGRSSRSSAGSQMSSTGMYGSSNGLECATNKQRMSCQEEARQHHQHQQQLDSTVDFFGCRPMSSSSSCAVQSLSGSSSVMDPFHYPYPMLNGTAPSTHGHHDVGLASYASSINPFYGFPGPFGFDPQQSLSVSASSQRCSSGRFSPLSHNLPSCGVDKQTTHKSMTTGGTGLSAAGTAVRAGHETSRSTGHDETGTDMAKPRHMSQHQQQPMPLDNFTTGYNTCGGGGNSSVAGSSRFVEPLAKETTHSSGQHQQQRAGMSNTQSAQAARRSRSPIVSGGHGVMPVGAGSIDQLNPYVAFSGLVNTLTSPPLHHPPSTRSMSVDRHCAATSGTHSIPGFDLSAYHSPVTGVNQFSPNLTNVGFDPPPLNFSSVRDCSNAGITSAKKLEKDPKQTPVSTSTLQHKPPAQPPPSANASSQSKAASRSSSSTKNSKKSSSSSSTAVSSVKPTVQPSATPSLPGVASSVYDLDPASGMFDSRCRTSYFALGGGMSPNRSVLQGSSSAADSLSYFPTNFFGNAGRPLSNSAKSLQHHRDSNPFNMFSPASRSATNGLSGLNFQPGTAGFGMEAAQMAAAAAAPMMSHASSTHGFGAFGGLFDVSGMPMTDQRDTLAGISPLKFPHHGTNSTSAMGQDSLHHQQAASGFGCGSRTAAQHMLHDFNAILGGHHQHHTGFDARTAAAAAFSGAMGHHASFGMGPLNFPMHNL